MYPRVEINLELLKRNVRKVRDMCCRAGVEMWAVTKCFCGMPEIARAIVECGVSTLADSRIKNLKKFEGIAEKRVLLRIPMASEVEDVVRFADYSLNSELTTLKLIGKEAIKARKVHKAIIMVDLGDLREGVWVENIEEFIEEAREIEGISIRGIGTNLTCYGGVVPDETNLGMLVKISSYLKDKYNLPLEIISGGNSSSIYLLKEGRLPPEINNLRIGEALLLGRETAFGKLIEGLETDVFKLKAEIVELKEKPSVPVGKIGVDAFGKKPVFEDKGIIKRAIVAVGRQDIASGMIVPVDRHISILGASSDHMILDVSRSLQNYSIGDIVEFYMDYGCLLRSMTSEYVYKMIIR